MKQVRRWIAAYGLDALAVGGIILIGLGLGLYSAPLLPITLGLGALLAVRFGQRS